MEANPLTQEWVKQVVSEEQPGFYRLGYLVNRRFYTIYIGRSDNCLRTRLLSHTHKGWQDHFAAWPTETIAEAYRLECLFYHLEQPYLKNKIHPAQSDKLSMTCPYCHQEDLIEAQPPTHVININAD